MSKNDTYISLKDARSAAICKGIDCKECAFDQPDGCLLYRRINKLPSVTPVTLMIKKGATNGDVIEALFPDLDFRVSSGFCENYFRDIRVKYDFWNESYMGDAGDSEDENN